MPGLDLGSAMAGLAETLAADGQPDALYERFDAILQEAIGHKLFTLLVVAPGGAEVARVYSSRPKAYPLGGRKPMGPTPWGAHVLEAGRPWRGDGASDLAWAYPDHALISSLGLGAAINTPVRYAGRTLGATAVLDVESAYDDDALRFVAAITPLLIPAFLCAVT